MKIIAGVCVVKDNKILMVQEGWGNFKGMWNMPAGKLEEGENIFDGAIREMKEETGYDVKLTGLVDIKNCIFSDMHHVLINFQAEIVGGGVNFDADEIMNVKFLDLKEVSQMTDKELRGGEIRKSTIRNLLDNKVYPLEIVSNYVQNHSGSK